VCVCVCVCVCMCVCVLVSVFVCMWRVCVYWQAMRREEWHTQFCDAWHVCVPIIK